MPDLDANTLDPFENDVESQGSAKEPQTQVNEPDTSDDSLISALLEANGIKDSSKIKFEEEDGTIVERPWKELSKEEQLSILSPQSVDSDYNEDEINLIKKIRETKQSPSEYLETLKKEAITAIQQSPSYEIDGITDDELFVLDTIDKYGEENVSDEQLEELIKNAKSDPDLYAKTIENLRNTYKHKEDEYNYQKQQELEAQQEQEFKNFSTSVLDEIQSLDSIGGQNIELSVDDMNDVANFILNRDEDGNSEFGKIINDPKQFVQLAFWALKGNDIMNEISSQMKMAYEKGVEAGKKGQSQLTFNKNPKDNSSARNNTQPSATLLDIE